jgi:hypothetical protein
MAVSSSASVLIALASLQRSRHFSPDSGALIRQRFDAACALAAKQPIAEISANAEAIADSIPWRNASRNENGSVPVQATMSFRRHVRGAFQLHTRLVHSEASYGSMLRIETTTDGPRIILRLIGRVHCDCIEDLRQRVQNQASFIVLDLADVDLVDLPSVRFLRDCQDRKIELRNCAPYILEWIRRERLEERK